MKRRPTSSVVLRIGRLEENLLTLRLYSRNPDRSSLHIIGARAFVHKQTHIHKLEKKAWKRLMIRSGKGSRSYRIYNPQTRRITESRNVTFIETLPKALPLAGQEKLLETNEETLQEAYHWDILGHLPLLSSPDEDQVATKASLAPSTSSDKKEHTASTGSAPISVGPNSESAPSFTGLSSDTPSNNATSTAIPLFSKDNSTTNYPNDKIATIDRTGTRC